MHLQGITVGRYVSALLTRLRDLALELPVLLLLKCQGPTLVPPSVDAPAFICTWRQRLYIYNRS